MEVESSAAIKLLSTEISEFNESLACQINVIAPTNPNDSGNDDTNLNDSAVSGALSTPNMSNYVIGQANVELWVSMVEEKCNILRQEVEVLSPDMSRVVGSVIVDVRGFRLVHKCATLAGLAP